MSFVVNPYRFGAAGATDFGLASRDFDGASYVIADAGTDFVNLGTISMAFWIKPDDITPPAIEFLLGKYATTTPGKYVDMNTSGNVRFICNWSTADGIWTSAANLGTGWTHVAVTYDDSSTTNDPIFYINGTADAAPTETATPNGTVLDDASAPHWIGARNTATVSRYYNGLLADVRVFDDILTAGEVSDLANGIDFTESLIGWWFRNTDDLLDWSVNVNDGTNEGNGTTFSTDGPLD